MVSYDLLAVGNDDDVVIDGASLPWGTAGSAMTARRPPSPHRRTAARGDGGHVSRRVAADG